MKTSLLTRLLNEFNQIFYATVGSIINNNFHQFQVIVYDLMWKKEVFFSGHIKNKYKENNEV